MLEIQNYVSAAEFLFQLWIEMQIGKMIFMSKIKYQSSSSFVMNERLLVNDGEVWGN